MSHGTGLGLQRGQERDFVLSTTEEFVKKFNGTRVINKVRSSMETQTPRRDGSSVSLPILNDCRMIL